MTPRHAPRASELGVMIQCAVRIGSILLICVAATSVVAGPRGGAPFGGGVHFGGGGGAPHFSRPHFSAPAPFTPQVGPQLSARPGHLLQHVTPGRVGSAPLLGSVRQIPRPTNQAANAFPQCWRPCAPCARRSQNSMPCSTMKIGRASCRER